MCQGAAARLRPQRQTDLDDQGAVRSQRMIADFCIDLTSGLRVWKRDAEAGAGKFSHRRSELGTFMLSGKTYVPGGSCTSPSAAPDSRSVPFKRRMALTLSSLQAAVIRMRPLPYHLHHTEVGAFV
jgi:hypothetical protein